MKMNNRIFNTGVRPSINFCLLYEWIYHPEQGISIDLFKVRFHDCSRDSSLQVVVLGLGFLVELAKRNHEINENEN